RLDRWGTGLGGFGARLGCAPASRDVELRSVVLHDPAAPRAETGDVFLAVGVESAAEAVRLAREASAAVVLVRGTPPLERDVLEQANAGGVAVLLVEPARSEEHTSE